MTDHDPASRLLAKIRRFVAAELTDEERTLFSALLAPGVARAYATEDDVEGFSVTTWRPTALPDSLRDALVRENVRITGLDG